LNSKYNPSANTKPNSKLTHYFDITYVVHAALLHDMLNDALCQRSAAVLPARPYRVRSTHVLCCWTDSTTRCLPTLDRAIQ